MTPTITTPLSTLKRLDILVFHILHSQTTERKEWFRVISMVAQGDGLCVTVMGVSDDGHISQIGRLTLRDEAGNDIHTIAPGVLLYIQGKGQEPKLIGQVDMCWCNDDAAAHPPYRY